MADVPSDTPLSTDPPVSAASGEGGSRFRLRDLLGFERMLTPILVKFLFYAGSVLILLTGLVTLYTGATARFGGGAQVFLGLVTIVVGPLLLRIVCEQIIVLFGIYDRLGEIRDGNREA